MKLPLASRSKVPLHDSFERITDDPLKVRAWEKAGFNTGMLLGGLSALDFDDIEAARRFAKAHPELLVLVNRTYRAVHILFEGETKQGPIMEDGVKVGDKKSGPKSYLVIPPSRVWNKEDRVLHEYKWVRGREGIELPPFPEHLFGQVDRNASQHVRQNIRHVARNVRAYLTKVESIQGNNGSRGLCWAAVICRDSGMTEADAVVELLWWNTLPVVQPPWPADEIARAVHNIYQKATVNQ